jgi:formamidopyrimidine-DNA glycosylase
MPELPEVETVRRTLEKFILNREIRDIDIFYEKMLRNTTVSQLRNILNGKQFTRISRYGKYLLLFVDQVVLMIHLRMEGKFFLKPLDQPKDKHEHVIIYFSDGETLRYQDTRKFGTIDIFQEQDLFTTSPLAKMGPEPYSETLTVKYLYQKLKNKTVAIKSALLDQTIMSGLGNIYVDEVLFISKINPVRPANKCSKKDVERIIDASRKVINKAIELGGSSIRSYTSSLGVTGRFQNELLVHTKQGEACPVCETIIIKQKVNGRGTYTCPNRQNK